MTVDEFQVLVGQCYDQLPDEIQSKVTIVIDESERPDHAFAYFDGHIPMAIFLCYDGFKRHGDFSIEHINRVIRHEVEHLLFPYTDHKHSEHGQE